MICTAGNARLHFSVVLFGASFLNDVSSVARPVCVQWMDCGWVPWRAARLVLAVSSAGGDQLWLGWCVCRTAMPGLPALLSSYSPAAADLHGTSL